VNELVIYYLIGLNICYFFADLLSKMESRGKILKINDPEQGLMGCYEVERVYSDEGSITFSFEGRVYRVKNSKWEYVTGEGFKKNKLKNKRRIKMPRILRWIVFVLFVSLLWKFVINIEEIVSFVINRWL